MSADALHRPALRQNSAQASMPPMRPPVLNPLFASLTSLPGVGPKLEKLYARLLDREAPRAVDLLFHLPSGAIDRRARPKLRDVQPGQVITVAVTVDKHRPSPPHRSRAPYRIYTHDDTGDLTLTFFNAAKGLSGKTLAGWRDALCVRHCRILRWHVADGAPRSRGGRGGFAALPLVEPVYPLTEGLALGKYAAQSMARWHAYPICRNGKTRLGWRVSAFPPLRRRYDICTGPRSHTIFFRKTLHGPGLLTMNCSPGSSRSPWCERTCAGNQAAAAPAKAACAHAS